MGLGALGSCLGVLVASTAATAAWASEGRAGKKLSFTYISMIAAPKNPANTFLFVGVVLGCGLAECFSAYFQGKIGAAGIRCLNENGGQGFELLIIALGIIETVGIFGMVFGLAILNKAV